MAIEELEEDYLEDEDTQKDKYLTFSIAEEDYAIEIRFVMEIIGIQKITEVPDMPHYIRGVINLRGKVIPVIDVRKRFGLPHREYDERTCIVVVDSGHSTVGMIVDEVSEVLSITAGDVDVPPQTNKGAGSRYIQGMGKTGDRVKIILALQALLEDQDEILARYTTELHHY